MKHTFAPLCLSLLGILAFAAPSGGQEAPPLSAADLAAQLGAAVQDGNSAVRLRMKIESSGGGTTVLQVQIKARRTAAYSEVLYQVLWPNERKGESFVLRQQPGKAPEGQSFQPPETLTRLDRSNLLNLAFGSDLAYLDVVENFFLWENQSLTGNEKVNRVDCVILESQPGSKDATPYGKVVSWIDPRRMVTMKVEKYDSSGNVVRRIETTQVVKDDQGRSIPAGLTVRRPGSSSVTEIDGSNIRHDVSYTDADFTTEALTNFKVPR